MTRRHGVARDIVFLEAVEINPVVVHGGGKAITRAMEKAGLKASFIQGQRVTDEATAKSWMTCSRAKSTLKWSAPSTPLAAWPWLFRARHLPLPKARFDDQAIGQNN